jgi:phage terminase large subunit-like protein
LAISNIKKTGKTFTNAVLLAWRWLSMPGEHFAIGNDLDQSAGRQFQQIADMIRRNPYLKRNARISKRLLVFTPTGSTIKALSVDAAGNAGANHLTASHTEAWGIIYEAGIRAFEELTPPPGRFYGLPSLRVCDSYGGFIGESDTWHNLVDRGLVGERISDDWPIYRNAGLLMFHMEGIEAQERCFRGTPEEAEIYYTDQRTTLRDGAYLRLHENKRATGDEQFIPIDEWDICVDETHRPIIPPCEQYLYVGVDASIKHDCSAVVSVYHDPEQSKVVLARHRIWYPSPKQPLDLDGTIGDYLRDLYSKYSIREIRYDPFQLHDLSTRLRSDGLPMVEFAQSVPNLTQMGQNLFELIKERNIQLYPDREMRLAVSHTIAVQHPRGWRIAKEKTSHKIDVIVALAMAALAAIEHSEAVWLIY